MKTKKKYTNKLLEYKGFTLLELLAVIVILAVIALIAVPLILNLIDRFRKNSFTETARQIYEAGEKYLVVQLKGKKDKCVYFDFSKNYEKETVVDNKTYIPLKELSLKGQLPVSGILEVCNGEVSLEVSNGDTTVKIDKDKNSETEGGTDIPDKPDVPGVIPDETYKGKWVNYTPDNATWDTARDGVATSTQSNQGKFDIYDKKLGKAVTGQSKNNSITCYGSNYVNKYNGFRIMDIDESGTMILIHAGTPECYYHEYGKSASSVSILATPSTSSNPGTGKAWTKYGNASLAQSVHYMDEADFNTAVGNSSATSTCYNTSSSVCENNSFVDIGSYYWLATQEYSYNLYYWFGSSRKVSGNSGYSFGVRPVVVLKPGIKIGTTGTGTEADPYELSFE